MAAIVCFQELFRACILYRVLASVTLLKSSSEIVCEACVCCPPMQLHEQQGRESGLVVSLETITALEYRVQDPTMASQYSCCVKATIAVHLLMLKCCKQLLIVLVKAWADL